MQSKIISSFLLLFFLLINFCSAESTENARAMCSSRLTTGVAQQGDAKINFVRYFNQSGSFFIEMQHVSRGTEDYMIAHVQFWSTKDINYSIDKIELKSNEGNGFVLQEEPVVPKTTISSKCIDKWYKIDNLENWIKLGNDKKIKCFLYFSDGDKIDMRVDEFLRAIDIVKQSPKDLPITYGPCYSVFFPNKTYQEIKDVFIYNINYRNKKHKPICINDYWRYVLDENEKSIGFSYGYKPNNVNFVKFFETPTGTWLNWDSWEYLNSSTSYEQSYLELSDRSTVTDVIRIIEDTYSSLEPQANYGFTLKYRASKDTLVIDSVFTDMSPELSPLKSGDQIIAVNGIDTTNYPHYKFDYITTFNNSHPDLTLTIKNKAKEIFNIKVKAKISEPLTNDIDYSSINKKETYLRYEKRSIAEYYTYRYAPYEIFDPYGPQDFSLLSPRTAPLDAITNN